MPVPQNKVELLSEITSSYSKLKVDLKRVPTAYANTKELGGHAKETQMSVRNLVAYLIGWGELVLKWHHQKQENQEPDFPETGYKWNQLGELAQKFYTDYEDLNFAELCNRLDQVVANILKLVQETDNESLFHKPWYQQWTQGKMIQLNTASPYKNARTRLRKWLKMKAVM